MFLSSKRAGRLLLAAAIFWPGIYANAQVITTIAGTGIAGFGGDSGPATNAMIAATADIVADNGGNLFVADYSRIRKIDGSGIITTVAGIGPALYSGDNGPATDAGIECIHSLATDHKGNLYFSGFCERRVRRIDTAGIITTIGGTGVIGYSGDGGPATNANLHTPMGICADRYGNILIADQGANRIRKIDTNGIITTIAGTGTYFHTGDGGPATAAGINSATDIGVDNRGNIYASQYNRIRMIDTNGIINTIAGGDSLGNTGDGGPAIEARITCHKLHVDGKGVIYIADANNSVIRKITPDGIITRIAGTGIHGFNGDGLPALSTDLYYPMGIYAYTGGQVYIGDMSNNRVRTITTNSSTATGNTTAVQPGLNIFPNPAQTSISISLSGLPAQKVNYQVLEISGKLLAAYESATGEQMDITLNLSPGMYLVKVTTTAGVICRPLAIQ